LRVILEVKARRERGYVFEKKEKQEARGAGRGNRRNSAPTRSEQASKSISKGQHSNNENKKDREPENRIGVWLGKTRV